MKAHLCLSLALVAATKSLLAEPGGSLTPPPGAPAPTMKSLDLIEARTPLVDGASGVSVNLGTGAITISQPGSYYLTDNVAITSGSGILIASGRVTIDLNGFTVASTAAPASGSGIEIGADSVTVINGHIAGSVFYDGDAMGDQFTGPGFLHGVSGLTPANIQIKGITVTGVDADGINLKDFSVQNLVHSSTLVESCTVRTVGGRGIFGSVVKNCNVAECGDTGIQGLVVSNCRARSVGGSGIEGDAVDHCIGNSTGSSNVDSGIRAFSVSNSRGFAFDGYGIFAGTISHCRGSSVRNDGIRTNGDGLVSYSEGLTQEIGRFGIVGTTVIGCRASSVFATNKYLMP